MNPLFDAEHKVLKPALSADRAFLALTGALFAGGLMFPIFFPASPKAMRTLSLVTSLFGAVAFTCSVRPSQDKEELNARIQKARKMMLDNQMKTQITLNLARDQVTSKQQLLYWIQQQPAHQQAYWLQHFGLMGLVAMSQAQTVDVQATPVGGGDLAMPASLAQQQGVQQAIADQQKLDTSWFDKFRRRSGIVCGESHDGKCLGKGTPIVMADLSVKKVEDVQVGDLLMGDDSTSRKVLGLARGEEEMFRIKPLRGSDEFVCNRSHIISVISGYSKSDWEVGKKYDLSIDDYLKLPKTIQRFLYLYRVPAEYPEQPLKVDPYYLGVWLGDGTSTQPCCVSKPDPEIYEHLQDMAQEWGLEVRSRVSTPGGCPTHRLCSSQTGGKGSGRTGIVNPLMDAMRDLGLSVDGAKFIPQEYLSNSIENRLQLLAGIVDTDAHLFNGCCYEITQKNHALAEQIIFLARSCGLMACRNKDKVVNGVPYKRFTICGNTAIIPTRIPRKKARSRMKGRSDCHTGFTVESLGVGDYYGFTIDGNHRFLLGDFTVTHNTFLARYDLACFISENQDTKCQVFIADPDYGSCHDDGEPNDWLGLEYDKHIYVEPTQIFLMVRHVSGIVDKRAQATAEAFAKKEQPQLDKYPVLLLIDELPAIMAGLNKDCKDEFTEYVCNILRRGLKQNVRFRIGTQTLAVSRTNLNQDVLQQTEVVMLWRAAQVEANYRNLGLREGQAKQAAEAIAQLPQTLNGTRVCVAFVEKKLEIRGIPAINPPRLVQTPQTKEDPYEVWDEQFEEKFGEQPEEELKPEAPVVSAPASKTPIEAMTEWLNGLTSFPSDEALNQQWQAVTGQKLKPEAIALLREHLAKASPRDGRGFSHFYKLYIKSAQWKTKRQQILERDGHQCRACTSTNQLEVNHRCYDRLGNESLEDLITLCHKCHQGVTKSMRSQRGKAA